MLNKPFLRPPPCITQGILNKAQLFEFDAITQLSRHLQGESAVHLMILSPQTTGSKPGLTFSKLELLTLFVFPLKGQFDSNTWPITANRWAQGGYRVFASSYYSQVFHFGILNHHKCESNTIETVLDRACHLQFSKSSQRVACDLQDS